MLQQISATKIINKMQKYSKVQFELFKKYFSTCKDLFLSQCLKERTLLQLSGVDAYIYLQGLITNDMSNLKNGASSMYSLFLNSKGRVLYDSIIYNAAKDNTYFIECDKEASSSLKDHLLMYKVRRKVNVDFLEDELDIWTLINDKSLISVTKAFDYKNIVDLIQQNFPYVMASSDPRLPCLGLRLIAPKNFGLKTEFAKTIHLKVEERNFYKLHRYNLGIGEGLQELSFEKCFPMEVNGDYLHGISFQKGCYIGQELTARTYHTGVIRKRFMPLFFKEEISTTEYGIPIFTATEPNKTIGKLQGIEKTIGVGLLRIDDALKANELKVLDTKCKTHRPSWWPTELPK